jgi:hypothetical protein
VFTLQQAGSQHLASLLNCRKNNVWTSSLMHPPSGLVVGYSTPHDKHKTYSRHRQPRFEQNKQLRCLPYQPPT